uniref:Proteasome activator Blm10 mid region domain-containing protein n=1 Tax=Parascaris equorum TaxID=6256 RepID=A0A914RI03_PAREQ
MQEGTVLRVGLEAYDPRLHLMEQHPTVFKMFALALVKIFSNVWVDWLRLAEGEEEDVDRLLRVLPYLLIDSLNQSEIINSILKELIHRYPDRPHPRPVAIFSIIHHVFLVSCPLQIHYGLVVIEAILLCSCLLLMLVPAFATTGPTGKVLYVLLFSAADLRYFPNTYFRQKDNIRFYVVVGRRPEATWLDNYWFNFTVRSLLLRLDNEASTKLRTSMQKYIRNGLEYVDPERVRNYPTV